MKTSSPFLLFRFCYFFSALRIAGRVICAFFTPFPRLAPSSMASLSEFGKKIPGVSKTGKAHCYRMMKNIFDSISCFALFARM